MNLKLTSLDFGLHLEPVLTLIGNAFVDSDSSAETMVDAVNRRGRRTRAGVRSSYFRSAEVAAGGALLLMDVLND